MGMSLMKKKMIQDFCFGAINLEATELLLSGGEALLTSALSAGGGNDNLRKKGNEAIRSIVINLLRMKQLHLKPQDLVNLKVLILHSSSNIKELLDFSKAPNLELDLDGCTSLTSLRSNIHLDSLRYLSLYSCMELKNFSVTSKNMIRLNLERTSIRQLPSSIGSQSKLEKLNLAFTYIESLPESIKNLEGLRHLDLRYCEKLRSLPKLPPSVETLDVRECVSLESVTFPPIAEQWKENKKKVVFWNCFKLDEHSLTAIERNAEINMVKFAHQHLSTSGDAQGADKRVWGQHNQQFSSKTRIG
ncbi:hypothetical protein ACSQ67_021558 [Phaseolus vulgaris]